MKVILLASLLNPLSAEAAHFFKKKDILQAVIVPKNLPVDFNGGIIYFFSMACIAFYRCLHVFFRQLGFKRSEHYLSLLEFCKKHSDVPVLKVDSQEASFKKIFSSIKIGEGEEYIIISCIFPFRIPVHVLSSKRSINIHPGILSENRGSNPYFWALAMGKEVSGITYHILTSKFDQGPILLKEIFSIESNFSEYKLEKITARHLKTSLSLFYEKFEEFSRTPLLQKEGVYHPKPSFKDRKKYKRHSVFSFNDLFCLN